TAITAVDNLMVGIVTYDYNDTVATGLVISQNPVGGTATPIGSSIDLLVSLGQPVVPDVVGKTETSARAYVTAIDHLTVGSVSYDYNDTVAAGSVISQNPAGGTTVPVGSSVDLMVSLGQPTVPNVEGMTEADANTAITAIGNLTVGSVTFDYSDAVAADLVIHQNPAGGTAVPIGSFVDIVVSLGEAIAVPRVIGGTETAANSALAAVGLVVGVVTYEYSDTVPAGDVLDQDPVPGATVPAGSSVDLVISLGRAVIVPDVVGRTEAYAESAITAAGLVIGSLSYDYNDTIAAGVVLIQNPIGGTTVPADSLVDLTVSLGQPEVPDVVGMAEADANVAITGVDNLTIGSVTYDYSDTIPIGFVIRQDPTGGTLVPIGSTIDLVVSLGQPVAIMVRGGNRLVELQNADGGWDWPLLDDGDPNSGSDANNFALVAMGLCEAYRQNTEANDPNLLAGVQKTKIFLLGKTNDFAAADGALAVVLDSILGGTVCVDHVSANFYDKLEAGTYYDAISGAVHDTNSYVQSLRQRRDRVDEWDVNLANLAAWDLGLGVHSAYVIGANTTEWVAGVKAEIDELDGQLNYQILGLAGAVFGLAATGEDYDPQAGEHAAASSLSDLAAILAGYQLGSGGFTWHMEYMQEGRNETVQETVYGLMALNQFDRPAYLTEVLDAGAYLQGVQLATGGWENYTYLEEENQITGEAIRGIAVALNQPVVPDVVGVADSNAIAAIEAVENLAVGEITQLHSDTVPAGLIISQDPNAGTIMPIGSSVDLVVSLGKPVVPDVVGMTEPNATTAITAVDHLVIGTVIYEYNDTIASTVVIRQSPVGGAAVSVGTSVNLVVSLGRPEVPDVVGMTEADANSAITAIDNLIVGNVTYDYNDTVPWGLVISQVPAAGASVLIGSAVDLVVSLGQPTVPDVVGKTEADANATVTAVDNLEIGIVTYEHNDTVPLGLVIRQSPVAGTSVPIGSTVDLVVSGVSVPDTVGMTLADANSALSTAGLPVGNVTYAYNDLTTAGHVINQNPAGGAATAAGSSVDLMISLGQPAVPNVLGMNPAEANSALANVTLVISSVTEVYNNIVPANVII
ncbi:MAG: PASTA domain-containing protein, partial [Planctomycetota bacterium]